MGRKLGRMLRFIKKIQKDFRRGESERKNNRTAEQSKAHWS